MEFSLRIHLWAFLFNSMEGAPWFYLSVFLKVTVVYFISLIWWKAFTKSTIHFHQLCYFYPCPVLFSSHDEKTVLIPILDKHWYSIYLCIFHSLSTCSLYVLLCSMRDNKILRNRHLHKLIWEAKEAMQSKFDYIMNDLEHYDSTIFPFLKNFIPIMNPVIFHHHIQYALNSCLNK